MAIAVGLLENLRLQTAARIMCFMSGPCTRGPGKVVETPKKENMRMHFDLEKDNAKHVKQALKFYDMLSAKCSSNGHIVDLFAGTWYCWPLLILFVFGCIPFA